MTDLSNYPKQTFFKTTLAIAMTAGGKALTFTDAPDFTMSATEYQYVTFEPKSSDNREVASMKSLAGSVGTLATRGLTEYEGGTGTAKEHGAGTTVVLSNPWQYYKDISLAIASKLDEENPVINDGSKFSYSDSNVQTWRDGGDLKLKDVNNSTKSLSQLAALGGTDEKVKVSAADGTAGYLNSKQVASSLSPIAYTGTTGSYTASFKFLTSSLQINGTTGHLTTKEKTNANLAKDASGSYWQNYEIKTVGQAMTASPPEPVYVNTNGKYVKGSGSTDSTVWGVSGFVTQAAASGSSTRVQNYGTVGGFSGFTTGSPVYLTDAGGVGSTPGTVVRQLGMAEGDGVMKIDMDKPSRLIADELALGITFQNASRSITYNLGFRAKSITAFFQRDGTDDSVTSGNWNHQGNKFNTWQVGNAGTTEFGGDAELGRLYHDKDGNDYYQINVFSVTETQLKLTFKAFGANIGTASIRKSISIKG